MAQWTLANFRTYLRLHLKDAATTWSDDEIDRAVTHALSDFSRFYPRERFYEPRLDFDEVEDESVTLVAGTKTLAYKPVKWDSETVTDTDGNACTRGTDYEMDYIAGSITRISGGKIASATETITVSYTRDKTVIDISSLTFLRISKVEYPVGQIPQDFVPFTEFGDMLFIKGVKGGSSASQASLQNDKHARIWYYAPHTAATASAAGTAPEWSDEIVLKGAEAYAYLMEAGQYAQQAITDFASARTELGLTTALHTTLAGSVAAITVEAAAANAALDGVSVAAATTALAAATTTLALIASGDDYHALADTALDAANTELDTLVAAATGGALYDIQQVPDVEPGSEGDGQLSSTAADAVSMQTFLEDGDGKIESVHTADDVSKTYMEYALAAGAYHDKYREVARLHLDRGLAHVQAIMGFIQEAQGRLNHVSMYIAEAQAEVAVGNGYSAAHANELRKAEGYVATASAYARQAETLAAQINTHLGEADRYTMVAVQNLELATSYREMGILRRNEFWAILGDRTQGSGNRASVPGNQSPTGGTGRDVYIG